MNAETNNKTDNSVTSVPSSSVISVLPPQLPRSTRGLSRLACLSDRQLEHINTWLDTAVPYREIVKLCQTEFQVEIPKTTIQRYNKRSAARILIQDFTDSKEAAAELSKYAATGDPSFSKNTLELLEQQAFDLALAYYRDADADDLSTLTNLWTLIHKAKSTVIRERHATVQEQKIALRRDELALKREFAAARLNRAIQGTPSIPGSEFLSPQNNQSSLIIDQSAPNPSDNSPAPNPFNPVNPVKNPAPADASSIPDSQFSIFNSQSIPAQPPTSSPQNNQSSIIIDQQPSINIDQSPSPQPTPTNPLPLKPYHSLSPCPLPPEVIADNLRYAEKVRTGQIIIDRSGPWLRAVELPNQPANPQPCNATDCQSVPLTAQQPQPYLHHE